MIHFIARQGTKGLWFVHTQQKQWKENSAILLHNIILASQITFIRENIVNAIFNKNIHKKLYICLLG